MKTQFLLFFLLPLVTLAAQNDRQYSTWRFALDGGIGYMVGSTEKAQKALEGTSLQLLSGDYYNDLKLGGQGSTDIHYFFHPHLGVGLNYSFFASKAKCMDDGRLIPTITGYTTVYSSLGETMYIHYIGPSFLMRSFINGLKTIQLSISASIGYTRYMDKGRIMVDNEQLKLQAAGNTLGAMAGVGIEYFLTRKLAVGIDVEFLYASFGSLDVKEETASRISVDLTDNDENVSRINASLGFRLYL